MNVALPLTFLFYFPPLPIWQPMHYVTFTNIGKEESCAAPFWRNSKNGVFKH